VSVAGFDDLPLAGEFEPALTTMRVPAEAMGAQAASYLIDCLEQGVRPAPLPPLAVDLIIRQTTGPAP
jgi:LacI family transcriptional regulator